MAISAADVKKLRDVTSAGMMECKSALTETDGDFEKAIELLRVKGQAKAEKRAGEREASEGLVASAGSALVELNAETDFVSKNAEFIETAQKIAEIADAGKPADTDALKALPFGDGKTVGEAVADLAIRIGEKIELGRVAVFDAPTVVYLHRRASDVPPAIGVLVEYDGDEAAARQVAQQAAALKAQFLTRDEVPADVVEREQRLAEEKSREEGKPEAALPKIVEGRVNAFFKEVVLLEQESVFEAKRSVKQLLDDAKTTVKRFARIEIGN